MSPVSLVHRWRRFWLRPWSDKVTTVRRRFKERWHRLFPAMPLPLRLPYGAWWLAGNDACSNGLFAGDFEVAERQFLERFLKPGMTVLDIGAHHGYFTMLSARAVAPTGRVIAFEPSPRERRRLMIHLRLNRCSGVKVEDFALSQEDGTSAFFLVDGAETGCNSLRPPVVAEPTRSVQVRTRGLDAYLQERGLQRVDFVKLDVEGAELGILKGASRLLQKRPRPVVMAEVSDVRTSPWGYPAREIVRHLEARGFQWFSISPSGHLRSREPSESIRFANLVAIPEESSHSYP